MGELGIVLTARPSWAKLKPVVKALVDVDIHPDLYVCASALLPRFGYVYAQVRQDFPDLLTIPVYSVFEGGELINSSMSTGALTMGLSREFAARQPKIVVIMADRHETLGASIAASYQNIKIAHLQGGEVSGNIDDKVRNANTMLADYHFVATGEAEDRVHELVDGCTHCRQGYTPGKIWNHGCPSLDVARIALTQPPVTDAELGGDGDLLDLSKPFLTLLLHPETESPQQAYADMHAVLTVLNEGETPFLVFWPGQDAGAEGSSKAIREFKAIAPFRTVRTLPPERFLRLMAQTTALLGNSSAGIRECSYIGTPVLNLGQRQAGRERAQNVIDCSVAAFAKNHTVDPDWFVFPRFQASTLYGDGYASPKIAATLKDLL